jgi:dTDP-4-dehydrorhamnose 3,5-epimerase-like enzyme
MGEQAVETIIPLRPPFVDERGEIQNLVDAPFGSALVMHSKKGAIRGNHYHKTDFHYCWLQSGRMIYSHRPVGDTRPYQRWVIEPGQLFYTPPMYEHIMEFTEDSVVFAVARNSRTMADYEHDTVRLTSAPSSGSS